MDSSQWPLAIGVVKPTEASGPVLERKARPQNDQALNCPRCNSTNTKFCYYNNYSLSQPRYLCKNCKRYWTHGGTLRNIPVGGSSRKNKRTSSSTSEASSKKLDLTPPTSFLQKNPNTHESQDFNLAYHSTGHQDSHNNMPHFLHVPFSITDSNNNIQLQSHSVPSQHLSAMQLLKSAGTNTATTPSFMVMPAGSDSHTLYSSGIFPAQEFKHSLNFCLDEYGVGCSNLQGMQETSTGNCRISFPDEDLFKEVPSMKDVDEHNNGQGNSTEVWNRMLNGGSL